MALGLRAGSSGLIIVPQTSALKGILQTALTVDDLEARFAVVVFSSWHVRIRLARGIGMAEAATCSVTEQRDTWWRRSLTTSGPVRAARREHHFLFSNGEYSMKCFHFSWSTRRNTAFRPRLEALEDRWLPTISVLNLNAVGPGSLANAIASAPSGATINFAPGLMGTIHLTGELAISKNLSIVGPGPLNVTVSGQMASRVFDVGAGATVSLQGLTIANGMADSGGGVQNAGTLTVKDCIFSDNKAVAGSSTSGMGGGLFNESQGVLALVHCTFQNNEVVGGNMGLGYGGGLMNEGIATVAASRFMRNEAVGGATAHGAGGGIANMNNATLAVIHSTFIGNLATDGLSIEGLGGGIDNENGSSLVVSNCMFTSNEAQNLTHSLSPDTFSAGGAINSVGTLAVYHSSFTGNLADGYGGANAGAISTDESQAAITACTFMNNIAIGAGPGASATGGAVFTRGFTTITGSSFTGNQAIAAAGADGIHTASAAGGGAIDNEGSRTGTTLIIASSRFTSNRALGAGGNLGGDGIFGAESGGGYGGAIDDEEGSALIITNSTLTGNVAQGGSGVTSPAGGPARGGVGQGGAIDIVLQSTATVIACTLSRNAARGGAGIGGASGGDGIGGAISVGNFAAGFGETATCSLTLEGGSVTGNQAVGGTGSNGASGGDGLGGALEIGLVGAASLSSLDVTGTLLAQNTVVGGKGGSGGNGGDGFGGAVYAASGATCLHDMSILANFALGGSKGFGGSNGLGVGGGVHVVAGATAGAVATNIFANLASTSANDVFGLLNPYC
jgi:hypothetical protein